MKLINTKLLPGFLLSLAVAIIAKIGATFFPTIGAASIAICLGIFLGNTFCKNEHLNYGTKFSESRLLEYSVALLGLTITFNTISHLGFSGFIFVVIMMVSVITFTYFLGKRLGFSDEMTLMIAGGNAVCGSSAIGAIAPAIRASDKEKGQSIVLINLLGTLLMFLLPFLGSLLFNGKNIINSMLTGGILQSVGQVVASASLINSDVTKYAMIFKITRILFLVVVVFSFEKIIARKQEKIHLKNANSHSKSRIFSVPWYILLFLAFCTLNTFLKLPLLIGAGSRFFSGWFEIIALAAIGLRLDLKKFLKEGPKFLVYMGMIGLFQIIMALILITLLQVK